MGGHVANRTEEFNFEAVVSCRSAYTRISGKQEGQDGSWWTLVTSVVEGLNILDVVTADRVVAQISVEHPADGGFPRISFTGSRFERLQVGGCDLSPVPNPSLMAHGKGAEARLSTVSLGRFFRRLLSQQAAKLVKSVEADNDRDDLRWIVERYGWMGSKRKPGVNECVLCSLVDERGSDNPRQVVRPRRSTSQHFGRVIFLGEVMRLPRLGSRISMIRRRIGLRHARGHERCKCQGQRQYLSAIGLVMAVLATGSLTGCRSPAVADPATTFKDIHSDFRLGNLGW